MGRQALIPGSCTERPDVIRLRLLGAVVARSVRSLRRDVRRAVRKREKRREIRRTQGIADRWNEGEMFVYVTPMERLGPSTFFCPECGIVEAGNEDGPPAGMGDPSNTNCYGVRNDDPI